MAEESAAFSSLMSFVSGLFSEGTVDRVVEEACRDDVLATAILNQGHTFRTHRQLRRKIATGLENWNGRRYGDFPQLSDIGAAELVHTSGLEQNNWPYATMPSAVVKPYLEFWRKESMNPDFAYTQEEADAELKRALQVTAEPDAMIRTHWGMLVLERKEEGEDGWYRVLVHASKAWGRDDDFHLIGGKIEDLLLERTGILTER